MFTSLLTGLSNAVALLGALACAILLRDPLRGRWPKHHHFRPHF